MMEERDWKDDKILELQEVIRKNTIIIEEYEELLKKLHLPEAMQPASLTRIPLPMELWPKVLRLKMTDKPIVFLVQHDSIYDLDG